MVQPIGRSSAAVASGPAPQPAPSLEEVAAGAVLRLGHTDEGTGRDAVAHVQRDLAHLLEGATTAELAAYGIRLPFRVHGRFDAQTDAAVRWFQDRHRPAGQPASAIDGRVGPLTLRRLQQVLGHAPVRATAPPPAPRIDAAASATRIAPRPPSRTRGLIPPGVRMARQGLGLGASVGRGGENRFEDVQRVQLALQRHGYLRPGDGFTAGVFDVVTEAALQRFQARNTPYRDVLVHPVSRVPGSATELALARDGVRGDVPHADVARHPDDRYLDIVSRNEGNYRSVRRDINASAGLSFGFIQFNQRAGSLGRLLRVMHQKDPGRFAEIFGPHSEELLRVTGASTARARMQPVGGVPLWDASWQARFREAGGHPPFIQAQREVGRALYLRPALDLARQYGYASERSKAIILDIAVQHGLGRLRTLLRRVQEAGLEPRTDETAALTALADLTKTGRYRAIVTSRRDRMLTTSALSDTGGGAVGRLSGDPRRSLGERYSRPRA